MEPFGDKVGNMKINWRLWSSEALLIIIENPVVSRECLSVTYGRFLYFRGVQQCAYKTVSLSYKKNIQKVY